MNKSCKCLKDIAFDVNKSSGYTVYIEENSNYVPYLVLTSDYNGNALLLRKKLLDDTHTFNYNSYAYSSYYPNSSIDKFLNSDFFFRLDPKIQNKIVNSKIVVTKKSSIGICGTEAESITRKIFLLSCTELNIEDTSLNGIEGKPLRYFNNCNNEIAYKGNEPYIYWLRTPETWGNNVSWDIGDNSEWSYDEVDYDLGVRPVFCLKNTQAIKKSNKVVKGQTVYVIAN